VALWVGLRALLGLYPGYGLDQEEKLRRHAYAVLATAAPARVFAAALQVGNVLSRSLLALGFLGLLLRVLVENSQRGPTRRAKVRGLAEKMKYC
jgi:hypothetical protein